MKDRYGNDLPEPMRESVSREPYSYYVDEGEHGVCHNCKHDLTNHHFVYRTFGNFGVSSDDILQGPLCPNCAELPPEHLPSRRFSERWW